MQPTEPHELKEWRREADLSELAEKLSKTAPRGTVAALPDFFIDRLVIVDEDLDTFISKLQKVARKGGGVLHVGSQTIIRGGNASNFASAIASLGVRVMLVACVSELGELLLRYFMRRLPVEVHAAHAARDSLTVALELRQDGMRSNVMLGYRGSLAEAKPEHFSSIISKVASADIVGFFNWAAIKKGTELAEYVLEKAKSRGRMTYMDPSDVTVRSLKEVKELVSRALSSGLVDVISLNENEALWVSKAMGINCSSGLRGALEAAYTISRKIPTRIDLHTSLFSASASEGEVTIAPCFKVDVKFATGAGDAWNAGNVFGELIGLSSANRLLLANAVAASYISRSEGVHPSLADVSKFIAEYCRDDRLQEYSGELF